MIDPPPLVDPADPLGQPTRARLFALLGELRRPAGTAELAERLELHPNGVRLHLKRLAAAGLVTRAPARERRGRPPDLWAIAPEARPGGAAPAAYHDLGRWLARALPAGPAGLRGLTRTGRQIGREIAPEPPPSKTGPEAVQTVLATLGFAPVVTRHEADQLSICLGNCPYRDAVRENQAAVCALHEGLTRGLLDVLEPEATLAAFIPHDPDRAGCEIDLRMPVAPDASSGPEPGQSP